MTWSISSLPIGVRVSLNAGELWGGESQDVTVTLNPPIASNQFTISTNAGDHLVSISVNTYSAPQVSHVSPAKGSNNRVNVAVGESTPFVLTSDNPTFPGAQIKEYQWQFQREGVASDSKQWQGDPSNSRIFTFGSAGNFTVYVRMLDTNGVHAPEVSIPVQAWNRPTVLSPPNGTQAWSNGKFVGVVNQPIPLQAASNLNGVEAVVKYVWRNKSTNEVVVQPGSRGMVGEFFSYPASVTAGLDEVETYVRNNNPSLSFSGVFETVDFPNGSGSFAHRTQLNTGLTDYFFARFTGVLAIQNPGTYKFHVSSDDGFRLKVNSGAIAEYVTPRGMSETSGQFNFPSAGLYPIELTYFDRCWPGA